MDSLTKWLMENWLTVTVASVGLLATYLTHRWSRRDRIPCYAIRHFNVIDKSGGNFPALRITYHGHGEELEVFSSSNITIWNSGRETIRKADIAKADPIQVRVTNGVFVDAAVIRFTREVNRFDCVLKKDKDAIDVTFDFLDRDDGAVIQVFHSAGKRHDLSVHGTIVGAAKWREVDLSFSPTPIRWLRRRIRPGEVDLVKRVFGCLSVLAGTILLVAGSVLPEEALFEPVTPAPPGFVWGLRVVLLLAGLFYVVSGWSILRRRVPKALSD
jgi:hypothetical protein